MMNEYLYRLFIDKLTTQIIYHGIYGIFVKNKLEIRLRNAALSKLKKISHYSSQVSEVKLW